MANTAIVIEDHKLSADVIKSCAETCGLEVLSCSDTAREGWKQFTRRKPEIVLLDLDLPDMEGLDLADKILRKEPKTRILVVSAKANDYTLYRVLRSGVFGFVDKTKEGTEVLKSAIEEIMDWRPYYAASVHQLNLSQLADPSAFPKILTDREQDLLKLFGVGMSDSQVAKETGLSIKTIKTHRYNITRKLKLKGTPELIQFALTKGFASVTEMMRRS